MNWSRLSWACCIGILLTIVSALTVPRGGPRVLYHSCRLAPAESHRAEPIVILHGLLGSNRNFQTWSRILQQKTSSEHDILCFDLRNHGRSALYGSLPMTYAAMADDVWHTLDTLGVRRCHLIGHSMGGKAAAAAALSAPSKEQVLSLALMDISPVDYQQKDFQSVLDSVRKLADMSATMQSMTRGQLQALVSAAFSDTALAQFVMANAIPSQNGMRWSFHIDSIASSMADIMSFLPAAPAAPSPIPTLVLKGDKSDFVKAAHVQAIAKLFPRYALATVRNAAHWLHIEQPEQSAGAVAAFLAKVKQADGAEA